MRKKSQCENEIDEETVNRECAAPTPWTAASTRVLTYYVPRPFAVWAWQLLSNHTITLS
jgi:hypothetical protein